MATVTSDKYLFVLVDIYGSLCLCELMGQKIDGNSVATKNVSRSMNVIFPVSSALPPQGATLLARSCL